MTTGALLFAFNNERTDYVKLASWNAQRIRRFLEIPVAVVTDSADHPDLQAFDRVIVSEHGNSGARYFEDYGQSVTWHNTNRTDAYSLSPWQQTLVLDADYVVDSDSLKMVLASDQHFMCFRHAFDVSGSDNDFLMPTFGRYKFPMWWATVMVFCKSKRTELIFDMMSMVKQHWQHYRDIYAIEKSPYRNDYALSIALAMVNGHVLTIPSIPWNMASVLPKDRLVWNGSQWSVHFLDRNNNRRRVNLNGTDFHAMGKKNLEQALADHS